MSEESERREFLCHAIDNLVQAHADWVDSDTPYLTDRFRGTTDEVIVVFAEGMIPNGMRELEKVISEMAGFWSAYRTKVDASGDTTALPGANFWRSMETVFELRAAQRATRRPMVESIKDLTEQKVSDNQICKIYGWVDEDDRPEIWRLREEREEPGKHTSNWVNPADRKAAADQQRAKQHADLMAQRQRAKLNAGGTPGPEPIEDLILQGCSASQIAKIKRISVEEVMLTAAELGLPPPQMDYEPVTAARNPLDKAPNEAQERIAAAQVSKGAHQAPEDERDPGMDDPSTADTGAAPLNSLETAVVEYYQAGYPEGEIATMLTDQKNKVTSKRVLAILRNAGVPLRDAATAAK